MFLHIQEIRITADDERRTPLDRSCDVFVVVSILTHRFDWLIRYELSQHEDVLEPQLRFDFRAGGLQNLRISERLENLFHYFRGEYQLECLVPQKPLNDLSGRTFRANERAYIDVRVKHGAKHRLFRLDSRLPPLLTGPTLSLHAKRHRLIVGQRAALLLLHHIKGVTLRETPHLLKALDRNQRCQWLAFTFDDEFVVAKRDAIEHVADPLTDVHRRYPVCHI